MKDSFFLKFRTPITYILVLIIVLGGYFYTLINTSLFPEITFPKLKIIADNGEQPIDKMMITVTKPLEEAIRRTPDLKVVRSTTSRGSCEISAFLDWKADINKSQQMMESRINQIKGDLPPTTKITIEQMNPSILPVMGFILESKDKSPIELKMIAKYTIKPFLSQIEGISEVGISGGKDKEYRIELNREKMNLLKLTPAMVRDAFSKTNFILSNGLISDYHRLYLTLTDARVHDINDIQNIVIQNDSRRIVKLSDVADVSITEKIEFVDISVDGHDGVLVNVVKQPAANLINLSQEIQNKLPGLQKILPKDVSLKIYYNQADFVNESVKSVKDALWIGLLFAIVIAFAFLRSIKQSLAVLFTIPTTIAFTLIVLYALGYTFNLMTLGAIAAAVGLIIDDAIVVIEQIHRIKEENPHEAPSELVREAIKKLFPAMIGSSLSTIVIFLPFSFMGGVAGAYFKVLAYTMIITLVCSFFITWIGLPVIFLIFNRKADVKPHIAKKEREHKLLNYFIFKPVFSFAIIILLVICAVLIIPGLPSGFLPEMDEGTIVLDFFSPPGTSLGETHKILANVDKIIERIPEVDHYSRRTGTQLGFFITEPNQGDYLIQLKKDRKKSTDEVINDIRKRIEEIQIPLNVDFGQVVNDMLGDLMSSVQPIEIKIYGDKPDILNDYADKISDIIDSIPGTADVFNGIVISGPSIEYVPDQSQTSRFNINIDELQSQLDGIIEGNVIGSMPEKEQMTDIRLFNSTRYNKTSDAINNSDIYLPDGTAIPLKELVSVNVKSGAAEINRENLKTMVAVTARLNNRDLGSVVSDIRNKINSKIFLPQGFSVVYGGAYAEQQQSFKDLLTILILAALLVLSVLLILFRDVKGSLIILFVSILGLAGSFIALYLTRVNLNVGSYTGVIMIVGIIAENATFTFHQFKMFLKENSVNDAVIKAVAARLRPNLMTATGAIIALMPLALALGAGAQLHQPLAIAVIGGFVIAQPLLIIVLPSLLKLLYRK
ncbi:MAG: efflux RND transporter permease subunit [Ignavibacteria bacterium]